MKISEKLAALIDVKSIVTIGLVATVVYVTVTGTSVDEKVFLLLSNLATMIVTYFFTKKDTK